MPSQHWGRPKPSPSRLDLTTPVNNLFQYAQYSARLAGYVWELSVFGPDGVRGMKFDSLASMTVWIDSHMVEPDKRAAA